MRVYDLYFGQAVRGRGSVTPAEWKAFRDEVITPTLPDGYTIWQAQGAWRGGGTGETETEGSMVLEVAMPDTSASQGAISRLRGAWRHRFHQQSVGMIQRIACGSFDGKDGAP